jgi:AcrR family transcriptional regulator
MRRSKKDWLEAGLKVLGETGVVGLTIERLLGELGVTKGSFYHHFENVEAFHKQLIVFWADQYISTSAETPDEPEELVALLDGVMQTGFGAVTGPEIAIRAWPQQDEMVRIVVEEVDALRQAFVLKVFKSVTSNGRQARLMTDMLSTMLVGSIMVLPRIPPDRVLAMYEEFKRLYSLEGDHRWTELEG